MTNNLKKFRNEAGLSLQGLGDLCCRSKAQLHQLEKSESYCRLDTAYLIAKVLDKSVYDIWPDNTKIVEEKIIVRRVVNMDGL